MALPEPDVPQERKKKTIWLLAGGAASLLIPLAGAIYMRWSDTVGAPGPSGRSDLFERRDGGDKQITPSQTAVVPPSTLMAPPPMPGGKTGAPVGSSLDFIKPNSEMSGKVADVPKASTATAAPAAAPPPAVAPAVAAAKPTAKKKGRKEFTMPKLQPSRGFTNFSSGKTANDANAGPAGGQSPQDMMKNLPAGAENNPQIQQYLKQQQSGN